MSSTKLRLWYARLVMGLALIIYGFLASLYAFNPLAGIDMFGVSLSGEAHSVTFLRTGVGAMFSSLFFAALIGLARPKLFMTCLTIIVGVMTIIVALRVYGLIVDGITDKNLSELRTEGLSWLFFVSGWVSYPRAVRRYEKTNDTD
ncbi:MAG: hypothetical protein RIC29_08490 [Rhodospirillaceae bacterium]